jgi:hypothetical protein
MHKLAGQENRRPDSIIPMGFIGDIPTCLAAIPKSGLGVVEAQTMEVSPASWHSLLYLLFDFHLVVGGFFFLSSSHASQME